MDFKDDIELVKKCFAGDKKAWHDLVKKYSKLVYKTIWDTLKQYPNPGGIDVNDVYQDVFVKILEKLHQWSGKAPLLAWIKVIARRTTIDHLRKQKRIPQESYKDELGHHSRRSADGEQGFADECNLPDEHSLPDEQGIDPDIKICIDRLLTKLNPTEVTVIKIHFLEEWSLEEIAEFLNKKVGAISTIKSRALTKLRKICPKDGLL